MDRYLAIAYFQQGVSNFLLTNFEEAKDNFDNALLYMRGNDQIDYGQLGLKFCLYTCEILFNRGLCSLYMQNQEGLDDLRLAAQRGKTEEHKVIYQAIRARGQDYTVFSIPVGILFRPDEAKVRNIAARDYLGKARLIAATDAADINTGFGGFEKYRATTVAGLPMVDSRSPMSSREVFIPNPASTRPEPSWRNKHAERDRDLEFARLDQAMDRKASVSGVRDRFPLPTRLRTTSSALPELPITPPPDFRGSSRNTSSISSSSSLSSSSSSSFSSASSRSDKSSTKPELSVLRVMDDAPTNQLHPLRDKQALSMVEAPTKSLAGRRSQNIFSRLSNHLQNQFSPTSGTPVPSASYRPPGNLTPRASSASYSDYTDVVNEHFRDSYSMVKDVATQDRPNIGSIKVKIFGLEDTRTISIDTHIDLQSFQARLAEKFKWSLLPKLFTKDDDGELILLQDQEDLDSCCDDAVQEAQRTNKLVGRLEIWVEQEPRGQHRRAG